MATIDNMDPSPSPVGWSSLPYYTGNPVSDAGLLAKRDRLHASIAFYSSCNELGCGDGTLLKGDVALAMKEAFSAADGSRAVTGNMGWQGVRS
jgi:hypothetical protein